ATQPAQPAPQNLFTPVAPMERKSDPSAPLLPSASPPAPSRTPEPEIPKPVEPPKPRRIYIWDSAHTESRDAIISAAGFADLYTMRADIRFRQEHLRAKGLVKEESALNELVARINAALEKKKKAESLE